MSRSSKEGIDKSYSLFIQDETAKDTFPPLPPPVFSDETSPTGTLTAKDKETTLTSEGVPDPSSKENDDDSGTLTRHESISQPLMNGDKDITEIDSPAANATEEALQCTSARVSLPVRTMSIKINRLPRREGEVESSGTFRRISSPESKDVGTFRHILSQDADKNGGNSPCLIPPDVEEDGEIVHPKSTPEPTGDFVSLYEEVAADESPVPIRNRSPSPYEDPATLLDPNPCRPMPDFFPLSVHLQFPSMSLSKLKGQSMFLLVGVVLLTFDLAHEEVFITLLCLGLMCLLLMRAV